MKARCILAFLAVMALFSLLVTSLAAAQPDVALTFTVNSSADVVDNMPGDGVCETAPGNGICTLRAAVMEANHNTGTDTIVLPEATYTLTIPGVDEDASATGDLDITDGVTILGAVGVRSDIDATGLGDRVLDIHTTVDTVTISRVVITGGSASLGGGIYARDRLVLSDAVVIENDAEYGGGIYSAQDLTLTDVIVVLNSAANHGGGVFIAGQFTAQACDFMNNDADDSGGGVFLDDGSVSSIFSTWVTYNHAKNGGGIYNEGELTLKDSHVDKNLADFSGGGISHYAPGTLNLQNVKINENHGGQYGGGIRNQSGRIQGRIVHFDLNTAGIGGAITNNFGGEIEFGQATFTNNFADQIGGAIANGEESQFVLTESTIMSNTATLDGGGISSNGIIELRRVTIYNNQAENGGGIKLYAGELSLENSTISGNSAKVNGGGIHSEGKVLTYHRTIAGNRASTNPLSPSGSGGGVYNVEGSKFVIRDTILFANLRQSVFWEDNDCYGTLNTEDYNLVGVLDGCLLDGSQGNDLIGVDPLVGALANNGGFAWTHALPPGSPAIDAANPAGCFGILGMLLTTDQRGHPLPWDGDADGTARCDIGAFEAPLSLIFLPLTQK